MRVDPVLRAAVASFRGRRGVVGVLLLLLGILVVVALVEATGPADLAAEFRRIGPWLPLLALPWLLVTIAHGEGWRWFLIAAWEHAPPEVIRGPRGALLVFWIRTAGETLNAITPFFLGGEPVKVALAAHRGIAAVETTASLLTSRTVQTLAWAPFTVLGAALCLGRGPAGTTLFVLALAAAALNLGMGLGLLLWQRRGLVASTERTLRRIGLWPAALGARQEVLDRLDRAVTRTYGAQRAHLLPGTAWYVAGWFLGALETWLILLLLGHPVDPWTAIAIEVLTGAVKGTTSFVPGSAGAQEGGYTAVVAAFGLPPAVGLSYALLRRAREILWVAIGAILIVARPGRVRDRGDAGARHPSPGMRPTPPGSGR